MVKLKFSIHRRLTKARKNGYSSVIFNIHYRNQLHRLFSGICVMDSQWDYKMECVKHGISVRYISYAKHNKRLNDEEKYIIDYFNKCFRKNSEPSFIELKDKFNNKFNETGK